MVSSTSNLFILASLRKAEVDPTLLDGSNVVLCPQGTLEVQTYSHQNANSRVVALSDRIGFTVLLR